MKTEYHEASHFVAFLLYIARELGYHQGELHNLSVVPNEDSLGRLSHSASINSESPEGVLKTTIAGPASDFILSKEGDSYEFLDNLLEEWNDVEKSDIDLIIDLVIFHVAEGGNLTDFLHPVFEEVVSDLKSHWAVVEFVANELQKHQHIEGTELDALAYITAKKLRIEI